MTNESFLRMFEKLKILVYGDVMLDVYIDGRVDRISQEAPVPVFLENYAEYRAGGAANVAQNLAALGCEVTLICVAGIDNDNDLLSAQLDPRIKYVPVFAGRPTTRKLRYTVKHQQIFRADCEITLPISLETSGKVRHTIESQDLSWFDGVVVSDYGKGAVEKAVFETLMTLDVPVYVDPKQANMEFYKGCDWIKPNLDELQRFWPKQIKQQDDLDAACTSLRAITGAAVLLTCGADGMQIHNTTGRLESPARAHQVADVTGAGDTVIAVFSAALMGGLGPDDAMKMATVAAGLVVQRHGTSVVRAAELWEAMNASS